MIIDGHAHACGSFRRPEQILTVLDALRVDKVLLCPGLSDDEKERRLPGLGKVIRKTDLMPVINAVIRLVNRPIAAETLARRNEYVHTLAVRHPRRILQCYWTDPAAPDAPEILKRDYRRWAFRAVKAHQCLSRFAANSENMDAIARFAGENNLPFLIHLGGRRDVRDFIHLVRHNQDTVFIVAHLIGLELCMKAEPRILRKVFWEISPPQLLSEKRVLRAVNHFGAQRVVLGSDTPYGRRNLQKNIRRLERMNFSAIERDLVLGDNLASLLAV